MRFLVDADFLIALSKEDDANHKLAVKKADTLIGDSIFITPFAIPEAATVLSYRVSQKAAKRFLEEVRKKDFTEMFLDEESVKEADKIFLSQNKKGTSWIDCFNVAVVKNYQLNGILSFDKFFKKFGFLV